MLSIPATNSRQDYSWNFALANQFNISGASRLVTILVISETFNAWEAVVRRDHWYVDLILRKSKRDTGKPRYLDMPDFDNRFCAQHTMGDERSEFFNSDPLLNGLWAVSRSSTGETNFCCFIKRFEWSPPKISDKLVENVLWFNSLVMRINYEEKV